MEIWSKWVLLRNRNSYPMFVAFLGDTYRVEMPLR